MRGHREFLLAALLLLEAGASEKQDIASSSPLARANLSCGNRHERTSIAYGADAVELFQTYGLSNDEFGATVLALIYGIPLNYYEKEFDGAEGLAYIGVNNLTVPPGLANAQTKDIVHPNADTKYGLAALDLSESDVTFTLPPMQTDRMYLLGFWDPYGSQYAGLGSISGNPPGKYLLRRSNCTSDWGVEQCEGYQACVNSPTAQGTLLVRVEVKNNSTDLEYTTSWVDELRSSVKATGKHPPSVPPLKPSTFIGLSNNTAIRTLQLTARLMEANPPWYPYEALAIDEILRIAGIQNGAYVPPKSVNLTAAAQYASTLINATPKLPRTYKTENNGWSIISPDEQGIFRNNTDFLVRTYFGIKAYLDNTADEALYPMPSTNTFELTNSQSILLSFSGKPPVNPNGFWSITAYDSEGYLISNPLNVYIVGDRSNITYPNGTLVYPDYLRATYNSSQIDSPFQVLVQGTDVSPPSNWTANWLPVPSNGSDFTLTFRLYDPTSGLVDGSYEYPVISKQAAIL